MCWINKLLLTIACTFFIFTGVLAQTKAITGTVNDVDGHPLTGVTVRIKGSTLTTTTGTDGSFSINPGNNSKTLVLSYIGMETQEVNIGARISFQIQLKAVNANLDEVVVVGYGTQKKVNLTGSVSTVSAEELTKRPVSNVSNLLQGKVAGLQVSQAYAKPGDESNTIRIRGLGTFSSAGSDPLVLIDGIAGDMSNVDPNDVESVSVLKDAASSAIYGARAANGVILITTKKGKSGRLNIEYNGNVQAQKATRLPDLFFHVGNSRVAVVVCVPSFEGFIFCCYADESCSFFSEPACHQASKAKFGRC